MPHRLLIRLLADGAAEWLALGRDGAVVQGPASGWPQGIVADECVLLVPAEDVLLLEAPRVAKARAQLAQALPFAIEEQLAAPVEQLHLAFDERSSGDSVPVALIARARFEQILATAREHGVDPDRVHAESQLLPYAADAPTALVDGDRVVLRWARSGALGARREEFAGLRSLLAPAVALDRLHVVGTAIAAASVPGAAIETIALPLRWLAARLSAVDAVDLRQGEYGAQRRRAGALGLWRWAAVLAGVALVLALAQVAVERRQLQQQAAAAQAEMQALLRQAVPGIQRIVDPVAQMRAALGTAGDGAQGGALPLLSKIAPSIAGSGRYTIEAIEYRGGALELVVTAPDVASLDGLRETLTAIPPLQVELTGATPGTRGVEGRLRIREGGA